MIVTVRFESAACSFEKTVSIDALPDIGDDVLVKPVGDWVTLFGDEPVFGHVQDRSFVEADALPIPEAFRRDGYGSTFQCILTVRHHG